MARVANNERVLRVIVAIVSGVALELAAVGAPLLHAHLDDDHDGHHRAVHVHAHLGGHESARHAIHNHGPAIASGEDPERATSVQFFLAVEPTPFSISGVLQAPYVLAAPIESIMRRPPAVAHSHDPPDAPSRPSRAPPSSLS